MYTKEEVQKWHEERLKGKTNEEIAVLFNVPYRQVLHYSIKFGFRQPNRKIKNPKNNCINPDFFEKIDSEIKAYYLGFLIADGNIRTSYYSKHVGMALQTQDKYILEKLNSFVSPNSIINKYKNSYKWTVSSDKMVNDLISWGITERKSYKEMNLPKISKELYPHLIRGIFDGDGTITIKSTGYSVASICSNSKNLLEDIAQTLRMFNIETRPISIQSKNRIHPLYVLYIKGREHKIKFREFLYKNATVFLKRKYSKFMAIPC